MRPDDRAVEHRNQQNDNNCDRPAGTMLVVKVIDIWAPSCLMSVLCTVLMLFQSFRLAGESSRVDQEIVE